MNFNTIRYELQNILSGASGSSRDSIIKAVANHIRSGKRTSPLAEEKHQNKAEETKKLIEYAEKHGLIIHDINYDDFISEGAEQKVFIDSNKTVLKINDAIYYASWEDYFHNLLIHNYFFAETAYKLLGFHIHDDTLYAVVNQNFIQADEITDLSNVKSFLNENGFVNTKNNDYYNPVLGVILEDLHDENVLTQNKILYFIDTVFYVDPEVFWKKDNN